MKVHFGGRVFLVAALVATAAVLAVGFFAVLGVRSGVAGPDPAPPAAPPNPGHSWSEIGDLPGTMWHSNNDGPGSGLDADTLDGQGPGPAGGLSAATLSRLGFAVTTVDWTGDVGRYSSVTIGADGLPIISYYDYYNSTDGHLKVAHCGNVACNGGVNFVTTVDSTGNVGAYSSITIGADWLPIISYMDVTNSDLKVIHCGDYACSAGNTVTTVDSTSGEWVGGYSSVTVGADGLPIISYYGADFETVFLKVAHCGNVTCTAGNTKARVAGGLGIGSFSSVTIGTVDGMPLISLHQWNGGDLMLLHCGNVACTAGNTLTAVDSPGDVGRYTSVTVGSDGLPVISYYDATNNALKVVHCGNVACTAGNTITTFDGGWGGDVGVWSSVTIGADGLPVISYRDVTNGNLRVAHCGNATCNASGNSAIQAAGHTGSNTDYGNTSVTVGADGLPVISYYDADSGDLVLLHCSNRSCLPFHRPR